MDITGFTTVITHPPTAAQGWVLDCAPKKHDADVPEDLGINYYNIHLYLSLNTGNRPKHMFKQV